MTKRYIDVFNGDADGLCALVQLRRDNPVSSEVVTGIKRDINLLKRVEASDGDCITVLDISFEKNSSDVARLLDSGVEIDYVDHHKTGDIPKHPNLNIDIDLSAETCTSLIVDKRLGGKYRAWAITAAFGDNLAKQARELGAESGLGDDKLDLLEKLGTYLNYNGYGADIEDLFFDPAELFRLMQSYDTPFDFLKENNHVFETLAQGYQQDMLKASAAEVAYCDENIAVLVLPNEKWSRRVSGVYSNDLVIGAPDRAHAVLTKKENGNFLVSVRAPLNRRFGADELVSKFPTGGGRKAAAGINDLPESSFDELVDAMKLQFSN